MKNNRCMKKLFFVHFNSGRRVKRKWAYEKPWALWHYFIPRRKMKNNGRMKNNLLLQTLQTQQEGEKKWAYEYSYVLQGYSRWRNFSLYTQAQPCFT